MLVLFSERNPAYEKLVVVKFRRIFTKYICKNRTAFEFGLVSETRIRRYFEVIPLVDSVDLILFSVLSSVVAQGTMEICKKVLGLTPHQISMCQSRPDAMIPVSEGIQMAIGECRWQFRNHRWNCTSSGRRSIFGTELRIGM